MIVDAPNTPIPTPSRIFRIKFSFYKTHSKPLAFLSFLSFFSNGDSPLTLFNFIVFIRSPAIDFSLSVGHS